MKKIIYTGILACMLSLGVVQGVSAEWDWTTLLGPLKVKQVEVAKEKNVDRLMAMAGAREWSVRTSAVLRLGELKTPEAMIALKKLYTECPYDGIDSPPDVSFFTLALIGAVCHQESKEYIQGTIRELRRKLPQPSEFGSDGYDRWLGALKGLSYYSDTKAMEISQDLVGDPDVDMLIREWAAECRLEQEMALKGIVVLDARSVWVCESLEKFGNMDKVPYKSESAIRYRAMQRRLEAYALASGRVEALLSKRISKNNKGLRLLYTNLARIARTMRGDPRIDTPVTRLGRF